MLAIIVTGVAWWWTESAITCDAQDENSVRGICLMKLRSRAEEGNSAAQWAYGDYLAREGQYEKTYEWHRKAASQAKIGLDLRRSMDSYCASVVPGFEPAQVEAIMQRVAKTSPDAHLRLFQLYVTEGCGAFDLDKASGQIPLLSQCAYLTLEEYLKQARMKNYTVQKQTREAMHANLVRCSAEITGGRPQESHVAEFIPVQQKDIDELSQSLDAAQRAN